MPGFNKKNWSKWAKMSGIAIAVGGIGFLIGLYAIAPMFAQARQGFVPSATMKMPAATVRITNPEGGNVTLPVRIASTYDSRDQGLRNVGSEALNNIFLLYDQEEKTEYEQDYEMKGIRAPLTLAVIDANGKVLSMKTAKEGQEEVSVEESHRWVLATKKGLLEKLGIKVGSKLNPESIDKFKQE